MNLKLGTKLSLFLVLFVLVSLASTFFLLQALLNTSTELEKFAKQHTDFSNRTTIIYALGLQRGQAVRNVILNPNDETAKTNFEKAIQDSNDNMKVLEGLAFSYGLADEIQAIGVETRKDIELQKQVIELVASGKIDEAIILLKEQETPQWRAIKEQYFSLEENVAKKLNEITEQQIGHSKKNIMASYIIIAVIIILAIVIYIFQQSRVIKPVKLVSSKVSEIASGDLTVEDIRITVKDEVGDLANSFNTMKHNLKNLVEQVRINSEKVAVSSTQLFHNMEEARGNIEELVTSVDNIASSSTSTAQVTGETATAVEEAAVGIQRIAQSASIVSENSADTSKEADQGNQAIQKAITQMRSITESVNNLTGIVQNLGTRTKEIGTIIGAITELSEQTNLLALNAAIEAARAGEHGKGFAVVASEVKKLAEESKQSAIKIVGVLNEIQEETEEGIEGMGKVSKEVSTGEDVLNQAVASFQRIVSSIQSVSAQIQEVSAASEQLSASSEEIFAAVDEMSKQAKASSDETEAMKSDIHEQLASIQEVSSATGTLSKLAKDLQENIKTFKTK
ncbi:MAG TPA: methyl-accepting chemotaxis protein [Bacillus bacterium]|nr:methyl-accepting chemotaxis protein [Bacillus sp. (in: firmicutes)]